MGQRTAGAASIDARGGSSGANQRPHDRGLLLGLIALLAITLAASFVKGQAIFVFAYIMIVSYAIGGPRRHGLPWSAIGLKLGFVADLRRVWYLAGLDAVIFQVLPPTVGIAYLLGFGPELVAHIDARLPLAATAGPDLGALAGLLGLAAVLSLVEELVYRVTIQEGLRQFIGAPAAIVVAAMAFGLAHAVGASGSPQVILCDVVGVTLDGLFFGLIYARTRNLLLTWATHYAADVVGLIALATFLQVG
jgi:membrane protease YdiL (CAAX protease family)